MDDESDDNSTSNSELVQDLSDEQVQRSVVVSNVPPGTERDQLIIHFQRKQNGGGEIYSVVMLSEDKAIVTFDEDNVAVSILQKEQNFKGTILHLEPYTKEETPPVSEKQVFSLVSAKINPASLNLTSKELEEVLTNIAKDTNIKFIELCDGYWVSGSYSQINETGLKLSSYATTNGAHNVDVSSNDRNGMHQKECEPLVVDVQPELMHILRKQIQSVEGQYKIKIDYTTNRGKATLSALGNEESFEVGKEEFITLYQKNFPSMDKKSFDLNTDEVNVKQLCDELMKQLDVVIEYKDKTVSVYGRSEHVSQAMQRLQGKQRKTRKALKSASTSDVLPKPDTHAQLPAELTHTLESGVIVSVYQADITQQHVDAIVNAANERLEHGGGLAGAIVSQGGDQIQKESRQLVKHLGPVPVGQVAHTAPGKLPCKRILHAVGPQWSVHGPDACRELIWQACFNSLVCASQFGYRSIAIPAISSGIFGVPRDVCAEMLFTAAEAFSCEVTSNNQLKDIRFVNIDFPTNEVFRREFHKRYLNKGTDSKGTGNNNKDETTKKANDEQKTVPKDGGIPSNAISSEKTEPPKTYAAIAAIKRQNDLQKTSEGEPDSFQKGFQTRENEIKNKNQVKTGKGTENKPKNKKDDKVSKENKDKISKKKENTEDKMTKEKDHGSNGEKTKKDGKTTQKDMKDVNKTAKSGSPDNKNKKDEEGKSIESGNVDNDHQAKKLQTEVAPQENTNDKMSGSKDGSDDIVTDNSSMNNRPKGTNGNNDIGIKLAGRGKGRGALNLAPTFSGPGLAKRVNVPLDKQFDDHQETSEPGTEHVKSHSEESKTTTSSTGQQQDRQPTDEKQSKENLNSPQSNASPPGLQVTKEGLSLAAGCKDDGTDEKSPALQDDVQDSKCIKRKIEKDSSERPPKQRKGEIETVSGDNKEQNEEKNTQQQSDKDMKKEDEKKNTQQQSDKDMKKQDEKKNTQQQSDEDMKKEDEKKNTQQQRDKDVKKQDEKKNTQQQSDEDMKKEDEKKNTQQQRDKDVKKQDEKKNTQQQSDKDMKKEDEEKTVTKNEREVVLDNGQKDLENRNESETVKEEATTNTKITNDSCEQHADTLSDIPKTNQNNQDQELQDDKQANNQSTNDNGKEATDLKQDNEQKETRDISTVDGIKTSNVDKDHKDDGILTTQQSDSGQASNPTAGEETCPSYSAYVVVGHMKDEQPNSSEHTLTRESESSSDSIVIIDTPSEDEVNDDVKGNDSRHDVNESLESEKTVSTDVDSEANTAETNTSTEQHDIKIDDSNKRNGDVANDTNTTGQALPGKRHGKQQETKQTKKNETKGNQSADAQQESKETKIGETDSNGELNDHSTDDAQEEKEKKGETDGNGEVSDQSTDQLIQAFVSLSLSITADQTSKNENPDPSPPILQVECPLCNDSFSEDKPKVILSGCGHMICEDCQIKYQHEKPFICSTCEKKAGCNDLQPPGGQMKSGPLDDSSLLGFEDSKTIYVDYNFPSGVQGSCHPNPGHSYTSLAKRTFLPDTPQGQEVLALLHKTFDAGLLFTIGQSTSESKDQSIIFTDAEQHKTNLNGGPMTNGYPDPDYLERVKEQLQNVLEYKSAPEPSEALSQDQDKKNG